MKTVPTIEEIDALLPQTQCGQCGYGGCRPYAKAMQAGAAINLCPPGGVETLQVLGQLLQQDPMPFWDEMVQKTSPNQTVVIREAECIGCTKCIQACPVDAIMGTAKQMHVVLAGDCNGCGLCIEPCPVDCMDVVVLPTLSLDEKKAQWDKNRERYQAREQRLMQRTLERQQEHAAAKKTETSSKKTQAVRKDLIAAALARVQAKKKGASE